MKKKQKISVLFPFLIITLAFLLLYLGFFDGGTSERRGEYSVILYQYTDSDWTFLLKGIRQAEEDGDVVVNYVTMPTGGTAEDEIELLEREAQGGADGILMAVADSAALAEKTEEILAKIPVVTVETGTGENRADVSADDYGMGYLLGSRMAEEMKAAGEYRVYVIQEYMQRQSVALRFQGFSDALSELVPEAEIIPYSRSEGDFNLSVCIRNMYANGEWGAFAAAFDKYCTEALAQAAEDLDTGDGILRQRSFGIGNTEQIVSDLDTGYLKGLVYQNEFNLGYLGLTRLIGESRVQPADEAEIDYHYVTRETLYDAENQRLLFPIQ